MSDEWGNVRIPRKLIDRINEKLESDPEFSKMGFKTYSGFVTYIIQRELDRYAEKKY